MKVKGSPGDEGQRDREEAKVGRKKIIISLRPSCLRNWGLNQCDFTFKSWNRLLGRAASSES